MTQHSSLFGILIFWFEDRISNFDISHSFFNLLEMFSCCLSNSRISSFSMFFIRHAIAMKLSTELSDFLIFNSESIEEDIFVSVSSSLLRIISLLEDEKFERIFPIRCINYNQIKVGKHENSLVNFIQEGVNEISNFLTKKKTLSSLKNFLIQASLCSFYANNYFECLPVSFDSLQL